MNVVAQGLRVVEDFAVETGGVQVVNICLDVDETYRHHRRVALDRLLNRVNATADNGTRGYALLIFGQEPDETVVRTYQRLRSYNPVPVRVGACGDGWHTRNLPIERVIGGPVFRSPRRPTPCSSWPGWRPTPCCGGRNPSPAWTPDVFSVLDRALNRRASRNDPAGGGPKVKTKRQSSENCKLVGWT